MSWDYVVNEKGELEVIVSRWYNRTSQMTHSYTFSGFEPFEPVQVEICAEDDDKMVKPFNYYSEEARNNPHLEPNNPIS